MGVFKFQLTPPDLASRHPELRKAYVTGLDRTPSRVGIEFRQGLMLCHRDTNESGRLFIPWPVEGFGTPYLGTATLAERPVAYPLGVELARGRLNELRNQLAEWKQMGLRVPADLDRMMGEAHRGFVKAATAGENPEEAAAAAQASLAAAAAAANFMSETYTAQVLQTRLAGAAKLPTLLGCMLEGDPKLVPWTREWSAAFNAAHACVPWRTLAPAEGQYSWEALDAQVTWCRRQKIPLQAGPLLDFRPRALPDWIWLWEGDFDTLLGLVVDFVRQAVTRYRGKVPLWHVIHRAACNEFLGLSEEEQIRIAARAIQVARQADPGAQFTIGVDRPWAEWMGNTSFQLGPLHLADYLVRGDLGLAGVALEIAPGYSAPGSHIRDLFDFSRLLDLYALLNLPLHIWFAFPSSNRPDPQADPTVRVETDQWPAPPDEMTQAAWAAKWIALAVAKPFVRSVTWLQPSDATAHLYPHAGLFRPDGAPKPLFTWLKSFRREILA
jgi:hypothetical protein